MATTVMRDDFISVLREKVHLAVPSIRAQGPSVRERYDWALAPFLVIDFCASLLVIVDMVISFHLEYLFVEP